MQNIEVDRRKMDKFTKMKLRTGKECNYLLQVAATD